MRHLRNGLIAALLAAGLGGCSSPPDIGASPVAQLAGPWLLANRQETCASSFGHFGGAGFYRIRNADRPTTKYFDIRRFTVGAGEVTLAVENLSYEPGMLISMTFAVKPDQLRLIDMKTDQGHSFKNPPPTASPDFAKHMQTVFRLAEQHFTLDRCPATS